MRVSSGSDIRIQVTEKLEANASSGGDISYSGNPSQKNINESSGGDVSDLLILTATDVQTYYKNGTFAITNTLGGTTFFRYTNINKTWT